MCYYAIEVRSVLQLLLRKLCSFSGAFISSVLEEQRLKPGSVFRVSGSSLVLGADSFLLRKSIVGLIRKAPFQT